MGIHDIRGVDRAAILITALGENIASEVFKYMAPRDVHSVAAAMIKMERVSRPQLNLVLSEFCSSLKSETGLALGTDTFLRNVLSNAFGKERSDSVSERIFIGDQSGGLESLKWMEPRIISEIIEKENPQVIAIILSYLNSDQSAEIVACLPEHIRVDVLMRIASLDAIQPSAIHELNGIIDQQLAGDVKENIKSTMIDGVRTAANILKHIGAAQENEIIDNISEKNPELGQKILDALFVFDDLIGVDDRDIQTILREITSESLVTALKGSDEVLKDKIFSNMSKRAANMLREDIEERGSVRLTEAELAKKEILTVVRRLAEAGDVSLGRPGVEIYVQ